MKKIILKTILLLIASCIYTGTQAAGIEKKSIIFIDTDTLKSKSSTEKDMRESMSRMMKQIDSFNTEMKRQGLDYRLDAMADTPGGKKFRFEDGYMHLNLGETMKNKKWSDEAFSGNDSSGESSSYHKKLKVKKFKKVKDVKTQILGLDLGCNTYIDGAGNFNPTDRKELELDLPISTNVVLHLIRQGVNIYKHNIYLAYGVALDYNNYKLKNPYTYVAGKDNFTSYKDTINKKFSVNKLVADYVTIPVMLHFETNPFRSSRSLDIGVGGFAGMRWDAYTKQVSEDEKNNSRYTKVHDDFNLNPFRYGLSAQVGFSYLNFYVNYALSEMFEKNAANPKLTPVNFGIVLNGFNW